MDKFEIDFKIEKNRIIFDIHNIFLNALNEMEKEFNNEIRTNNLLPEFDEKYGNYPIYYKYIKSSDDISNNYHCLSKECIKFLNHLN